MATSSDYYDEAKPLINSEETNEGSSGNVKVKIASVGQTMSGKSSFINPMRGMYPEMDISSAEQMTGELKKLELDDEEERTTTLEKRSRVEFHIALVGKRKTGKSSFAKAITGVVDDDDDDDDDDDHDDHDDDATKEPSCYAVPSHANIKIWDLPSHSTPSFQDIDTYSDKFKLDRYDAYLLFTKGYFKNNDLILAKQFESMKKPFLLIRTNIDNDINKRKLQKKIFNEEELFDDIRRKILEKSGDLFCSFDMIYVISNFSQEKWDFKRLTAAILKLIPVTSNEQTEDKRNPKMTVNDLIKRDIEEIKETIRAKGEKGAYEIMVERLAAWKNIEISLAVSGGSGVGKSSFINAIRGLSDENQNAAKTGVVETTKEAKDYFYPNNPKITLWDLPGVGSLGMPNVDTYYRKAKLSTYDMFIIMTAKRFTQNDQELAKKLKSINKPFIFVRSMIDVDYHSEKTKKTFREDKMLDEIKDDCHKGLNEVIDKKKIFLISNKHRDRWDFTRLGVAISKDLPLQKKEAFNYALSAMSEDIVQEKVKELRGRVKKVAIKSVFFGVLEGIRHKLNRPKPKVRLHLKAIVEEVRFYRTQLGFPEENSVDFQLFPESLQKSLRRFNVTSEMEDADLNAWLKQFDTDGEDAEGSDAMIADAPDLVASFRFACRFLYTILETMEKESFKILGEIPRIKILLQRVRKMDLSID